MQNEAGTRVEHRRLVTQNWHKAVPGLYRFRGAWWALSFILACVLSMVCGLALGMADDWHGMVWPGINEVLALAVACIAVRRL